MDTVSTEFTVPADKTKSWFPIAGIARDGWSNEDEATATCMCGTVQLSFVSLDTVSDATLHVHLFISFLTQLSPFSQLTALDSSVPLSATAPTVISSLLQSTQPISPSMTRISSTFVARKTSRAGDKLSLFSIKIPERTTP